MEIIKCLILILTLLYPINCLNVLVWATTIGRSHITFMGGLADILDEAGYNVTLLLIENDPDVKINGSNRVKNIIRYSSPLVEPNEWSFFNFKQSDIFYTKTIDLGDFFKLQSVTSRICKSLLNNHNLIRTLKSGSFDVVIIEFFHFCPVAIFENLGINNAILATALGMTHAHYELLNIEMPLSYVPVQMTHMGSIMNIYNRIYNIGFFLASKLMYNYVLWEDQKLIENHFGKKLPPLDKLYRSKIGYVFTNTNEFTESTRPTLQSVKYIGGITTPKPKLLSNDFELILSSSKKGTILFSLGSLLNADEMPQFIKNAFFEAFRMFPEYNFIWKTSSNNSEYQNIYYRNWVPQVDLLADPRIKVFVTHCGMNSVQEALLFGVPLIAIPIFADQDSNAIIAKERGYAYVLNKFSVHRDDVIQGIKAVIGDDNESQFTIKAREASKILQSCQGSTKNEIVRLVNLSGTTQLSHLRVNTDHLSTISYYNIDVYIVFATIVIMMLYSWKYLNMSKLIRIRIEK